MPLNIVKVVIKFVSDTLVSCEYFLIVCFSLLVFILVIMPLHVPDYILLMIKIKFIEII